jgi:RecG-like helicase
MPARTEARPGKIYLDMPVTYLKGVGPARAEALRRLGVVTARDLLFHIPRRYEDASTISPISSLEPGMDGTIIGRVISKGIIPTRRGLRIFQAVLKDDTGMIEASWPGQPFLDRTIEKGDMMLLTGPVRFYHGRQLQPREYIHLGKDDEGVKGGKVLAVIWTRFSRCSWSISRTTSCALAAFHRCSKRCGWFTAPNRLPRAHRAGRDWHSKSYCSSTYSTVARMLW